MPHPLLIAADEVPLFGISESFLGNFDASVIAANCQAVTDEALGRIAPAYVAPLLSWGSDLKAACARILAYELKSITGIAPTNVAAGDENLLLRAQAAREWLDRVGKGEIELQGVVDSSTGAPGTAKSNYVPAISDPLRGW